MLSHMPAITSIDNKGRLKRGSGRAGEPVRLPAC